MLAEFNQRLESMVSSSHLTSLGSFGIAFLLIGIYIEGIRRGIKTLWRKVFKFKPETEEE
jgi:hypothetical protein